VASILPIFLRINQQTGQLLVGQMHCGSSNQNSGWTMAHPAHPVAPPCFGTLEKRLSSAKLWCPWGKLHVADVSKTAAGICMLTSLLIVCEHYFRRMLFYTDKQKQFG